MKTTSAIIVAMVIMLTGNILLAMGDKLMAPPPPGAVLKGNERDGTSFKIPAAGFTVSFHTPMQVGEAVSFYAREVGPMDELVSGEHYRTDMMTVEIKQLGVLKVYDIPENPGISVKSVRMLQPRQCISEYFRPFRRMADELEQYSRDDFNEICSRYGYLQYAYFGRSDEAGLNRDEVLHREYRRELDAAAGKELDAGEMMAEAQRLMQQGKMDEATELLHKAAELQQEAMQMDLQRLQEPVAQEEVADNWEGWLRFLNELEAIAFPTIVVIDYHPSHWPDDEWLRESTDW